MSVITPPLPHAQTRLLISGVLVRGCRLDRDSPQPRIIVRCGTRATPVATWLKEVVPGSRVFGPYQRGKTQFVEWHAYGEVARLVAAQCGDWAQINPARAADLRAWCELYGMESPC